VPKVRGRHRWQILLRGDDPGELLRELSFPQGWTVDIDPVSLL
jgi:primosomal protein N' (replication factor Y)